MWLLIHAENPWYLIEAGDYASAKQPYLFRMMACRLVGAKQFS